MSELPVPSPFEELALSVEASFADKPELFTLLRLEPDLKQQKLIVRFTKKLGTDDFGKVAGVLRGLGGEYFNAEKEVDKRFEFDLPKPEQPPKEKGDSFNKNDCCNKASDVTKATKLQGDEASVDAAKEVLRSKTPEELNQICTEEEPKMSKQPVPAPFPSPPSLYVSENCSNCADCEKCGGDVYAQLTCTQTQQLNAVRDLICEMRGFREDLKNLMDLLKSASAKPASPFRHVDPQSQPQEAASPVNRSLEDIHMLFPAEMDALLEFTQMDGFVRIKPRQFLNNFADVNKTVKDAGGEYVSAGKDSHFKVPNRADGMKPVQRNTRPTTGYQGSDGIVWTKQQGEKGEYEKATLADNKDNPAFYELEDWVRGTDKPIRDGFFYWFFDRGVEAVGRKRTQPSGRGRR